MHRVYNGGGLRLKNATVVAAPNPWWSIVAVVEIVEHKNSCFHADNDGVLRARHSECVYQAENNEIASMQIYPRIELNAVSIHIVHTAALERTNIIYVRRVDRWVNG